MRERITSNDLNVENYKPKNFESYALSNAEAKLTWDETDPERIKSVHNAFKKDLNLQNYEYFFFYNFFFFKKNLDNY